MEAPFRSRTLLGVSNYLSGMLVRFRTGCTVTGDLASGTKSSLRTVNLALAEFLETLLVKASIGEKLGVRLI